MNCTAMSTSMRVAASVARPSTARGLTALPVRAVRPRVAVVTRAEGTNGQADSNKKITRDGEPEDAWLSKGERDGENPLKDPIAIVGIVAIFFPFVFLLIGAATGMIDLSMKV